ncbi:FG-GAP-like repeat-containing protein [Anderseniella sp. Alg231-50]|uniref:FG-GAP-like repeat-containing protein n=1 Tax=Anderseniella sp. Alg231-50 TaxID=1922226 RepID=UPI000D55A127
MKRLVLALSALLVCGQVHALEAEGLPDGVISTGSNDVAEAWLTRPTTRYAHGILGDAIEAGGLMVQTADGQHYEHVLPDGFVFEDRRARPVDLDGDGRDEIVVVLSSLSEGAALAVYGVADGKLRLKAKTPHIGRSNRWLNPAEFADLDGDGTLEITAVWTPHLGRVLQAWTFTDGKLRRVASIKGYSNHAIGSPVQDLTEAVTLSDGRKALAIPTPAYDEVAFLTLQDGRFAEVARKPAGSRITSPVRRHKNGRQLEFATGRASLVTIDVP